MKSRKETIEQFCYAIASWRHRRERLDPVANEKEFKRADAIVDHWIKSLKEYIKNDKN